MVSANALQFHGCTHNFTQDFTSFGSLQPWAHFQSFHTVCSSSIVLSGSFLPFGNLYITYRGHWCPRWCPVNQKKSPAFSSSSPPGKNGITSEVHVFSQLLPVHMIRTFKGIIHLMASSPRIFSRNPNGARASCSERKMGDVRVAMIWPH